MGLSEAQLVTFGTHIRANTDPVIVAALAAGNYTVIAGWYNQEASPPVPVWKTSVSVDEANNGIVWTEFMAVPVLGGDDLAGLKLAIEQGTTYARQNAALEQLFRNGSFDPSLQSIRDSLSVIFAGDEETIAALLALAKENARNIEVVFTGAPVQGAGVREFVGTTTWNEALAAVKATA